MAGAEYDKLEDGSFSGRIPSCMVFGQHRLTVPSNKEYSVPQPRVMPREVEGVLGGQVTADEWDGLA
jgi:hypothetical protein